MASGISLESILSPQISKVTKTTDNLIITIYGYGGLGKTPVATQMEKPYYLAFGKSGLSGLNNVPFMPVMSWSEFKNLNKILCARKNYEALHQQYHTLILDEMEVLYKYCEEYVASTNNVQKIKDGNGGYGLWGDLKDEWEKEMLRLIGSGFCVVFILHAMANDDGKVMPVGDQKRMLPILLNHSEIIGYVKGNGVNPETGRSIHSSLMLAGTDEYFARTRNEYFDPYIPDFTAENLVKAYYTAIERQEKAEGVTAISIEDRDKMYERPKLDFEEMMQDVQIYGQQLVDKFGQDKGMSLLTEIVEQNLGSGAKVMECTEKQAEAVSVILNDIKGALEAA